MPRRFYAQPVPPHPDSDGKTLASVPCQGCDREACVASCQSAASYCCLHCKLTSGGPGTGTHSLECDEGWMLMLTRLVP